MGIQQSLDVCDTVCPETFVRVKLALQDLAPGQRLEVTVPAGEAMRTVPRGVKEDGHRIVQVDRLDEGRFRLIIERGED